MKDRSNSFFTLFLGMAKGFVGGLLLIPIIALPFGIPWLFFVVEMLLDSEIWLTLAFCFLIVLVPLCLIYNVGVLLGSALKERL